MYNRALLLASLISSITACATTRPGPAPQLSPRAQGSASVPSDTELQAAAATAPSSVQLASPSPVALSQETPAEDAPQSSSPPQAELYHLRHGDVISIKFIKNPELDATVPVRPDGQITLPLVGEIMTTGRTLAELRTIVSQYYKDFIAQTGYGEVLKEGDSFELRFVYNPELNLGVRIRSDGKISLPRLGEIQAAGLRPSALYQVKELVVLRPPLLPCSIIPSRDTAGMVRISCLTAQER